VSTLRIPENVVGAFRREFWASAQIGEQEDRSIESGLQAALAEWGATEERGSVAHAAHGWAVPVLEGRLVTPWTPVDGGQ
jgi:hypothetical protein